MGLWPSAETEMGWYMSRKKKREKMPTWRTGRAEWKRRETGGRDQPRLASMAARFRVLSGERMSGDFLPKLCWKRFERIFVCELR